MAKRGPMSATDKRRQAGHKRPKKPGTDHEGYKHAEKNHPDSPPSYLFSDRRQRNGTGKRAS